MQKVENDLCAKKMIADYFERTMGPHDEAKAVALGLPPNKFEASYIALKAKKMGMPKIMHKIKHFIYDGKH